MKEAFFIIITFGAVALIAWKMRGHTETKTDNSPSHPKTPNIKPDNNSVEKSTEEEMRVAEHIAKFIEAGDFVEKLDSPAGCDIPAASPVITVSYCSSPPGYAIFASGWIAMRFNFKSEAWQRIYSAFRRHNDLIELKRKSGAMEALRALQTMKPVTRS